MIVGNLAVHTHQKIKDWVAGKRRIALHFIPTYSSWLNQIGIWFNILSRDVIRGGIWKSNQELVDQIMDYIKSYNQRWAKPLKWTYTGKPLKALYGLISWTQH